jgi:tetratricopeptide (TPR) repeat protein
LYSRGRIADAERAIAQALTRDPKNIHLYSRYLTLLIKSGKRDEASLVLDKLAALPGESAQQAVKICQAYERLGRKMEAITRLRQAIDAWPREPLLQIQLGNLLCERSETDEASKLAAAIGLLNSKSWRIWRSLALLHQRLGEPKLAIEAVQRAVELNPQDIELQISVIDIFVRSGDSKGSEDQLKFLKENFLIPEKEKSKLVALEERVRRLSIAADSVLDNRTAS